jgi:hypothetical protein
MARSLRYVNTATEFLLGTKDRYEWWGKHQSKRFSILLSFFNDSSFSNAASNGKASAFPFWPTSSALLTFTDRLSSSSLPTTVCVFFCRFSNQSLYGLDMQEQKEIKVNPQSSFTETIRMSLTVEKKWKNGTDLGWNCKRKLPRFGFS